MPERILTNTKVLNSHTTGVQRYLIEVMARKPSDLTIETDEIQPPWIGALGHAWEQLVLPFSCRGSLLWSPANTGPLACRNQVVTIHDVQQREHPEWYAPQFAAFYRFVVPRLVHRVAKILTVSNFTKSRLIDTLGVQPDRIEVTPLGVDTSVYRPASREDLELSLQRYGLAAGSYVLYVGSLQPRKNLATLIRAWTAVWPALSEPMRLVIVGKAERASTAAATAFPDDVPGLVLLGHVPDAELPNLYSGAALLANLSLYEGFGLPALEAMACGTPVLVSDTTAFPEVVGDAGMLVSPRDDGAVADALLAMLEDQQLRSRFSAAGLERVKGFSWETTAKMTWSVLADQVRAA